MAKLPDNIQKLIDQKQKFIDDNRDKLEGSVIKMQEALFEKVLENIIPELETKDGQILNTPKNLRLIEKLDALYNNFNKTIQSDVVKSIGNTLGSLNNFNANFFSTILSDETKKKFKEVINKTNNLMAVRLGVSGDGEVKTGGFLDSFVTDRTLLTELKQSTIRNVTGQQSLTDFRNSLKKTIVGDDKVKGGFEKYYRTFAYDVYQEYDRAYGKQMADEFKLDYALYQGGLIKDSRDFCEEHNNKVYTREEVAKFKEWKLPKDTKESPGAGEVPNYIANFPNYDPAVHLGGFNCRHTITWIPYSYAVKLRPDLAKSEPIKTKQVDYKNELELLKKDYQKALEIGDVEKMTKIGTKLSDISKILQNQPIEKTAKQESKAKAKGLSIDEARAEMDKADFKQSEKEAVTTYTKGNYTQINTYLRGQRKTISEENEKVITELDSFIKKAPKVEDDSYRGMSFSEKSDFENFVNMKKGSIFTDKGFLSTSYDKNVAQTFTNIDPYRVIITIKGKNGVYIEHLSDMKKEKEIIFGKDSSFKVSKIKQVKKGTGFATVEMEFVEI